MATSLFMITRDQWRKFIDHPVVEWSLFGLGVILLILSPIVGALPGPGGIIVAGIGLALVLRTSMWAKRHYVRLKKKSVKFRGRQIVIGDWTDWALRRRSAKRRKEVAQARETGGSN